MRSWGGCQKKGSSAVLLSFSKRVGAIKALVACLSLCAGEAMAQSGVSVGGPQDEPLGPTYGISEPDMLEAIEKKLKRMEKTGELAKKMEEAKERSIRSVQYPKPVAGLGNAKANKTYYFDPSVAVSRDIRDEKGKLIVKAGTRVNPFEFAALHTWLLFFDGSDKRQVALAEEIGKKYDWNIKPILVKGGPLELGKKWKRRVYFDQGGALVTKMGIQNVPALVTQEGKALRIDELKY